MQKLRITIIILLLAGLVQISYFTFLIYNEEKGKVDNSMQSILFEAFEADIARQTKRLDPIRYMYIPEDTVKCSYIIDSTGKKTYITAQSKKYVSINDLRYSMGTYLQLINLNPIDSILKIKLQQNHIPVTQTAIVLEDSLNHKDLITKGDTAFFKSAMSKVNLKLGEYNELHVTAYVNYSPFYIIKQIRYPSWLLLLYGFLFFCLIAYVVIFFFRSKRTKIFEIVAKWEKEKENNRASQTQLTTPIYKVDEEPYYRIGNSIFNSRNGSIYIGNENIKTSKREYDLLIMFLENDDHFLICADMAQKLWKLPYADCSDKIYTSISRLRKLLSKDTSIEIVNERIGYRLVIKDTDNTTKPEQKRVTATLPT